MLNNTNNLIRIIKSDLKYNNMHKSELDIFV